MKLADYRATVTSTNPEVLAQCRRLSDELLIKESERGRAAEIRATAVLAASGVLAGLLTHALNSTAGSRESPPWLAVAAYAAVLGLLLRSAFYCIRTMSPGMRHGFGPNLITALQSKTATECLQEEIVHKLWEYERAIPSNSGRLFWLTRAQRAFVLSVALFAVVSFCLRVRASMEVCATVEWAVLGGLVLCCFGIDWLVERHSIWNRTGHAVAKRPEEPKDDRQSVGRNK